MCDYAATQVDGKYTFSGVYSDDIQFAGNGPLSALTVYLCIFAQPLVQAGKLSIGFRTPEKMSIQNVEFSSDSNVIPTDRDRIVFITPITLKSPKLGKHEILLGPQDGEPISIHEFYLSKIGLNETLPND
ncbi:hypothetical protein [Pelagibacterium sediminicola]|uniref:hypothetical protein n=1 Tax=Pelagibacterium sediminicola TaxID=2248761 RepID=UPI0013009936|nr:hypothetical protein [Pelagibacterium sediminicola]